MNKPHKWADVIKAWADGKTVQCQYINNLTQDWTDYNISIHKVPNFFSAALEWRVKPKLIGQFKIGLFRNSQIEDYYFNIATKPEYVETFESNSDFIRWVTDTIEVYDPPD